MLLISSTFLGDSQTLLGVVATLLVLCLFYEGSQRYRNRQSKERSINKNDKEIENQDSEERELTETAGNNFLFRILHSEKEKIKKRIEIITDKSKELKKEPLKISEKVKNIAEKQETISRDLKNKAGEFISKYEMILSRLEISAIKDQYELMNSIESDNEQFRAPLFCFSLSILLFCIDELWMLFPSWHGVMTVFCGLLTFISIIYWIILWTASCFSDDNYKKWNLRNWLDFFPSNIGPETSGILLIVSFGGLSYWLIKLYSEKWNPDITVILIGFFLPLVAFGIIKLLLCPIRGKYSYSHILGHFFALSIYSALLTGLVFDGNNKELTTVINSSFIAKSKLVSILAVGFVLFNGLVMPFLFPLIRYRHLLLSNIRSAIWIKIRISFYRSKMKSDSQKILAAFGEERLSTGK